MSRFRILIPVSFRAQSDAALNYALHIARQRECMISCMYVIEKPGFITRQFVTPEMEKQIRRKAEIQLSAKVHRILDTEPGILFELIVTSGKVHHKILETATALNADLIIMGRSDEVDLTRNYVGSHAVHVLSRAGIPVLTLKSSKYLSREYLLVPVDLTKPFSAIIYKVIERVIGQTSRISLLQVLHPDEKNLEPVCMDRLKEARRLFTEKGIDCRIHLKVTGEPVSDAVLRLARELHSEQLMIMTQDEDDSSGFFVGSTARELLNKSELPLLSISPGIRMEYCRTEPLISNMDSPIPESPLAT